jgi:hypothetical protein
MHEEPAKSANQDENGDKHVDDANDADDADSNVEDDDRLSNMIHYCGHKEVRVTRGCDLFIYRTSDVVMEERETEESKDFSFYGFNLPLAKADGTKRPLLSLWRVKERTSPDSFFCDWPKNGIKILMKTMSVTQKDCLL